MTAALACAMNWTASLRVADPIGFLAVDDSAREAQPIATIAAPVFGLRQRVARIVCVHPLRALTSRQVSSIGRRLTRATGAISQPASAS
jgi:hypothetical protein